MATPEHKQHRNLTTIVATIGPASDSPDMVRRLITAGVGVFRLNFSHGDLAAHLARLTTVRKVSADLGITVACLGDLQGPKIRVGKIPAGIGETHPAGGGAIRVKAEQVVVFRKGIDAAFMRGGTPVLPLTYQSLVDEVEPGHTVLINDGAVRLVALDRDSAAGELRARVTVGGLISSNKGINLPHSRLSAPAITDRDWECAAWAVEHQIDFLALSFVREAADILQLREGLARLCNGNTPGAATWIPIIAKVEMPQAVEALDSIVEAADGVMVARGDLGVEMDIAQVPIIQKRIVATCRDYGKPCIVATQMLESMIENPGPTRAEATDIANAIIDGADAVMLSAETAAGKYPLEAVSMMARIVEAAELHVASRVQEHTPPSHLAESHRGTAALAHGAWQMAQDLNAVAVVCWSQNGGTARYLSQNRFTMPIIAYTSDAHSARQMCLLRGVTPVVAPPPPSGKLSEWNQHVDAWITQQGFARQGDPIILLAGRPMGQAKRTNTLTIHRVGEPTGFRGEIA